MKILNKLIFAFSFLFCISFGFSFGMEKLKTYNDLDYGFKFKYNANQTLTIDEQDNNAVLKSIILEAGSSRTTVKFMSGNLEIYNNQKILKADYNVGDIGFDWLTGFSYNSTGYDPILGAVIWNGNYIIDIKNSDETEQSSYNQDDVDLIVDTFDFQDKRLSQARKNSQYLANYFKSSIVDVLNNFYDELDTKYSDLEKQIFLYNGLIDQIQKIKNNYNGRNYAIIDYLESLLNKHIGNYNEIICGNNKLIIKKYDSERYSVYTNGELTDSGGGKNIMLNTFCDNDGKVYIFLHFGKDQMSWITRKTVDNKGIVNLLEYRTQESYDINYGNLPKVKPTNKYEKFDEVWNTLSRQYYDVDKLDYNKSIEQAMKAFVDGIGDPYTVYLNKSDSDSFQEYLKGDMNFEGIGAVVRKKEKGLMIEEIFKNSPAYKAGLMPLDLVLFVDGEAIQDLSLGEAVSKIRGLKGSEVELTIFRASEDKILKIKVIRDKIVIPTVTSQVFELTGGVNVAYFEIAAFNEETEKVLKSAIQEMDGEQISGVILDLRGNGGGYLTVAVRLASYFVKKGEPIVSAKYRVFTTQDYFSEGFGDFEGLPIIVLIDNLSASASEILAAGIRDNLDNSLLVGTGSFGKGSIQTMHDLDSGDSLKYTIGKWFTPKDINVDKIGIKPDVFVELDNDLLEEKNIDTQIQTAKSELYNLIVK